MGRPFEVVTKEEAKDDHKQGGTMRQHVHRAATEIGSEKDHGAADEIN